MRFWGLSAASAFVACASWYFAACGSSGGNGAPGNPDATALDAGDGATSFEGADGSVPIALGDLCPLFTQDLCVYLMQCNHAQYRDVDHCKAELDCFGLPQLEQAAAEGGVTYDPSKVGACHARFQADPCTFGFFLFTPDIFEVLALCPGTITPLLGAGAPCISSGECTQGLYCKKDSGCPGVCTAFSTVGQSCSGTARCDPSLECETATSGPLTDFCAFAPEAGAPCNGNCGSTEYCPDDPTHCSQNLWCDGTTSKCAPGVGVGAACGPQPDAGGSIACASNLWCNQVFSDKPGNCVAPSGANAPCNDLGCQKGFHCVGYVPLGPDAGLGTCVGPSPSGGPCKSTADCAGGAYCGNGTCGGGLALGASCQRDVDCQSGLTCANHLCAHIAYPGDTCGDATSACVFSLCRNGKCVDHAKVGEACTANADCATSACYQGKCFDTSVCPVP
jgi:hypothetical protein